MRARAEGGNKVSYNAGLQSVCGRISRLLVSVRDESAGPGGRDLAAALGWARRRGLPHRRRGGPGDGEAVIRSGIDQGVEPGLAYDPVGGRKKATIRQPRAPPPYLKKYFDHQS